MCLFTGAHTHPHKTHIYKMHQRLGEAQRLLNSPVQHSEKKKIGVGWGGEGWVKILISSQSCSGNGGPILGTLSWELSKLPPDRIPLPNSQHGSWNLELTTKVPGFILRSNNCIVINDTLKVSSKWSEGIWGSAKHSLSTHERLKLPRGSVRATAKPKGQT